MNVLRHTPLSGNTFYAVFLARALDGALDHACTPTRSNDPKPFCQPA